MPRDLRNDGRIAQPRNVLCGYTLLCTSLCPLRRWEALDIQKRFREEWGAGKFFLLHSGLIL